MGDTETERERDMYAQMDREIERMGGKGDRRKKIQKRRS
jgi:hypothetical protein